jgi:hypothetical protein
METILKVISFFVGLFVIANGVWVIYMPPFGDEPVGLAIIAVGIFIPAITLFMARNSKRQYD